MGTLRIECADALLQGKQTLVNLSSFKASCSVVTLGVGRAFRASQIDDEKLANNLVLVVANFNLAHGVRA
jgi:hypothetical protein